MMDKFVYQLLCHHHKSVLKSHHILSHSKTVLKRCQNDFQTPIRLRFCLIVRTDGMAFDTLNLRRFPRLDIVAFRHLALHIYRTIRKCTFQRCRKSFEVLKNIFKIETFQSRWRISKNVSFSPGLCWPVCIPWLVDSRARPTPPVVKELKLLRFWGSSA